MKNSMIFKFIAVLLCAASLMGAVGGIAGVAVLTAGDLYNKTVDQVIDQRIQQNALNYADQLALEFAGRELGGCPDSMLERYNSGYWFENAYPNYGYTILDAEGNVLAGYNEELKDNAGANTYTIPVSGQYMHLVSAESEAEIAARQADAAAASGEASFEIDSDFLMDTVAEVYAMEATFEDGNGIALDDGNTPVGQLIYFSGDYAVFNAYDTVKYNSIMTQKVTKFECFDEDGQRIFRMESSRGVGRFSLDSRKVTFASVTLDELTASVPENTEGMLLDADGEMVPENGIAINQVSFTRSDGSVIYEAFCYGGDGYYTFYRDSSSVGSGGISANMAGFLFYNQAGQLVYHSSLQDSEHPSSSLVYGVLFHNVDSGFIFQLDDPNGLGTLSLDNGNLVFTSYAKAAEEEPEATEAVEETVPVTVPETIPEETAPAEIPDVTQAETVPQETVPEETIGQETATAEPPAATEETVPSSASAVPVETTAEAVTEPTQVPEAPAAPEAAEAPEAPTAPEVSTEPTVAETVPAQAVPQETIPEVTEPVMINGKRLEDYQINRTEYHDSETGERMTAQYVYVTMPELTVEMYVDRDTMQDLPIYDVVRLFRNQRHNLLPLIGICLLIFAVFAVYLCTAAGRKPKCEDVRAGGLNRIPLDLYLFGGGFIVACFIALGVEGAEMLLRRDFMVGCGFAVAATFVCCLIFVGFCFAMVAQFKTPGGFWWRNSLCGLCIRGFMKFAVWLESFLGTKAFPALGRFSRWLWQITKKYTIWLYQTTEKACLWLGEKIAIGFRWIGKKFNRFLRLLPMTWQWLLGGCAIIFIASLLINDYTSPNAAILALILCLGIVLYGAHCFGVLSESTKRMSKGDLNTKVEDKLMVGCFEEFASDLNNLAGVAVVAAQKQLKSERMKTELITNVSHDIKTPLTSIINYVDLLQKPHTGEEQEQYLEVLDRQSQRLKKLIDDLMDMSKASTGNMTVEITRVDAVESVNQALGEFADKLDRAHLIPVFRHNEEQVPIMADGRLVWRVMSNLLSNAVKYAMPGTRLYIDLMTLDGKVILSLKNISREELNVDADELMERFVRGDDSRNTEGSGLGLNIAKSLMELQRGQLQLLVDGDLFKVTLIFPGA